MSALRYVDRLQGWLYEALTLYLDLQLNCGRPFARLAMGSARALPWSAVKLHS